MKANLTSSTQAAGMQSGSANAVIPHSGAAEGRETVNPHSDTENRPKPVRMAANVERNGTSERHRSTKVRKRPAIEQKRETRDERPKCKVAPAALYEEILNEWQWSAQYSFDHEMFEPDPTQDPVERWKIAIAEFCLHHQEVNPADFTDYSPLTREQDTSPAGCHLHAQLFLLDIVRRALFREEQESVQLTRYEKEHAKA